MTRSGLWSSMSVGVTLLAALLWSRGGFGVAEAIGADTEILGEQRTQVLDRLREQQREVTTLRATVIQRKLHPLLRGEAMSQGTLLFKRPNQVRWEVDKPERTIIVIDGHMLLIYRPDSNEAERRDLRGDVVSRGAVEFLTSGMGLDAMELEKRFQVGLYRENGRLALRLTPRSRLVAQAVASVTIYQDEAEAIPRQIVVVGRKGDRTETTLSQVTINPEVPEDAFRLRLGPGVRVTDTGRAAREEGHDR